MAGAGGGNGSLASEAVLKCAAASRLLWFFEHRSGMAIRAMSTGAQNNRVRRPLQQRYEMGFYVTGPAQ